MIGIKYLRPECPVCPTNTQQNTCVPTHQGQITCFSSRPEHLFTLQTQTRTSICISNTDQHVHLTHPNQNTCYLPNADQNTCLQKTDQTETPVYLKNQTPNTCSPYWHRLEHLCENRHQNSCLPETQIRMAWSVYLQTQEEHLFT